MDLKKLFNQLNTNDRTVEVDVNGIKVKIENGVGIVGLTGNDLNKLVPPECVPQEITSLGVASKMIEVASKMGENDTLSRAELRDILEKAGLEAIKEYQTDIFSDMVKTRLAMKLK